MRPLPDHEIETPLELHTADILICGTGVEMEFSQRPELAREVRSAPPPTQERNDWLARLPYLAKVFRCFFGRVD